MNKLNYGLEWSMPNLAGKQEIIRISFDTEKRRQEMIDALYENKNVKLSSIKLVNG